MNDPIGVRAARPQLGELVNAAYYQGRVTYVSNHGRTAAIVPVSMAPASPADVTASCSNSSPAVHVEAWRAVADAVGFAFEVAGKAHNGDPVLEGAEGAKGRWVLTYRAGRVYAARITTYLREPGEVIEVRDNGSEVWALSYVDGELVDERVVATADSAEGRVRDHVTDLAAEGFVEVD